MKMLRCIYICFMALLFSACQPSQSLKKRAVTRPNIVFICVDDLGWKDVGFMGGRYATPNIDKLAASGMIFTNAYAAAAVCSPTRAALLTGRYPARIGITDWIRGRISGVRYPANKQNPYGYEGGKADKLLTPKNPLWMEHEEITLAEQLKTAGYTTAHIGKWHLGPTEWHPDSQGFDVNIAGSDFGQPPNSYFSPYKIETLSDGPDGEYLTDREGEAVVQFINANQTQPFFLNLWHYAVHGPLQARAEMVNAQKEKIDARYKLEAVYAAMIESVDQAVGKVLNALETADLVNNTVIIFSSDNGGSTYYHDELNSPLRLGKGYPTEGGIRIPLTIFWPGVTKKGAVCETPVSSIDFFPTFCNAVNISLPHDRKIDGADMMPLLTEKGQFEREALFWHFPHYWGNKRVRPFSIIRAGDWKLIRDYENRKDALFNLANDFSENNNLVETEPEKAEKLAQKLDDWLAKVGAKLPEENPDYRPELDRTITEKTQIAHLAVDAKATLLTEASPKYGSDPNRLTDGIRATSFFTDGSWLGFEGNDLICRIDLGESKAISKISAGFMQDQNAWIFLPTRIEYWISENGEDFSLAGKIENDAPTAESVRYIQDFSSSFSSQNARYIKVVAKNIGICPEWHKGSGGKAWVFVDEIIGE